MSDQNHPLYSIDRDHVDRLLATDSPKDGDFVDLARLLMRYEDFPGANDLWTDMQKILNLWGIDREMLNERTRELWVGGYRPGSYSDEVVGSGFDTSNSEEN